MKSLKIFLIFLLFIFSSTIYSGEAKFLRVDFLDVGQGDSILIRTPNNRVVLIDGGEYEKGQTVVIPYLRSLKITKIDTIILTHPHSDHLGGLIPVIQKYPVGEILDPGMLYTTKTYEKFLEIVMQKQNEFGSINFGSGNLDLDSLINENKLFDYINPRQGNILNWDPMLVVEVLSPSKLWEGTVSDCNNNSIVFKLSFGSISYLFTGDMEIDVEKELTKKYGSKLRSNVIKVPHHGGKYSSNLFLLKKVLPQYAVIEVGAVNKYGHPSPSTLERYSKIGARIFRTDLHGNIKSMSDGTIIKWKTDNNPDQLIVETKTPDSDIDYASLISARDQQNKFRLNINIATIEELLKLPGIGSYKAQLIVRFRDTYGKYNSIEDLKKIPGFDEDTFNAIKDRIAVK